MKRIWTALMMWAEALAEARRMAIQYRRYY